METDVLPVHKEIIHLLDQFTDIQTIMRVKYKEYVEKNAIHKVFGLDSFHYQCRLFDLLFKQYADQYSFINNRMYCDYYKLYNMVKIFVKDSFKVEPRKRNFPPYKDLEQYKHYDMSDIAMLHDDISDMTHKSREYTTKKEKEITRDSYDRRLNIENYISNHNCNNTILKTKIELYEKYLNSYHIYHMEFLSNLRDRLRLFFQQTGPAPSIESFPTGKGYPLEPKTKYTDEFDIISSRMDSKTESIDTKSDSGDSKSDSGDSGDSKSSDSKSESGDSKSETEEEPLGPPPDLPEKKATVEPVPEVIAEAPETVTVEVPETVTEVADTVTVEVPEKVAEVATVEVPETVTEVADPVAEVVPETVTEVAETVTEEVPETVTEVTETVTEVATEVVTEVPEPIEEFTPVAPEKFFLAPLKLFDETKLMTEKTIDLKEVEKIIEANKIEQKPKKGKGKKPRK